jgi:hypothetical protein
MSESVVIQEVDRPLESNLQKLSHHLDGVSSVRSVQHRLSESFILLFLENFVDTPPTLEEALNWSNWTHHTYFAIRSTAKVLGLVCTFETLGRLDAVVQSANDYPGVILVAEWETNSSSVFGEGCELDKLWTTVNQYEQADAFLFTYCSTDTLYDLTKKVVQYWQGRETARQNAPSLFLTIVAYQRAKRSNRFVFMRTLEISPATVLLWHDYGFVSAEEYLECVQSL